MWLHFNIRTILTNYSQEKNPQSHQTGLVKFDGFIFETDQYIIWNFELSLEQTIIAYFCNADFFWCSYELSVGNDGAFFAFWC